MKNGGHVDLERLSAYAPMGQIFAIFANSKGKSTAECVALVEKMAALFRDAKRAVPELMKHCFLSLEGAELIGCDEAWLPRLKEWGVRWVNLTWNHPNALSGTCITGEGLSAQGRSFVRWLYELGMYVDVSHLSDRGFWDLCEMEGGPIVASHSNARALCNHCRNLTDEMAKAVFASGGFVGINLYTAFLGGEGSTDSVIAHMEHFLELGGEYCLGMGSDYDGADVAPEFDGVEKLPHLWEALRRRNYSEALIENIAYGNLARFLGVK
jgi:membrane dipeptidase